MYRDDRLDFVGGLYLYEGEACGEFGTVLGLLGLSIDTGGCVDTSSEAFGRRPINWMTSGRLPWVAAIPGIKTADVFRYTYAGKILDQGDYSADPIVVNRTLRLRRTGANSVTYQRQLPSRS